MLSVDNDISPNEKWLKITLGEVTFGVIKESLNENTIYLMLSLWERNEFYNNSSIKSIKYNS